MQKQTLQKGLKFSFAIAVFAILLTIIWASSASVRNVNWYNYYFDKKLANPNSQMVLTVDSPKTDSFFDPKHHLTIRVG